MPLRHGWMVYTLTIPLFLIAILLLNASNTIHTRSTVYQPDVMAPFILIRSFVWNYCLRNLEQSTVEGRYTVVRRGLGLDERPIRLSSPSGIDFSFGVKIPSDPILRSTNRPKFKRSLDFVLVDEASQSVHLSRPGLPLLDDADNAPLTLTEDASWDYSNSKLVILDNFARFARRDEEEAAAAMLAKSIKEKMRTRAKGKRRKKDRGIRGPSPVTKVWHGCWCGLCFQVTLMSAAIRGDWFKTDPNTMV